MKITAIFLLALGATASVFASPGRGDEEDREPLTPQGKLILKTWQKDFDDLKSALLYDRLHANRKDICDKVEQFVTTFAEFTNNRLNDM
ncbi:hypothetical protein FRC02_008701, partial [Tulasnella sp. 418]